MEIQIRNFGTEIGVTTAFDAKGSIDGLAIVAPYQEVTGEFTHKFNVQIMAKGIEGGLRERTILDEYRLVEGRALAEEYAINRLLWADATAKEHVRNDDGLCKHNTGPDECPFGCFDVK